MYGDQVRDVHTNLQHCSMIRGVFAFSGTAFRGVLVVLHRTEDAHTTYSTGV